MEKTKKVDIIMPYYNMRHCVKTALASVAMQDGLDDIVVTVVDDHSDEAIDDIVDLFKPLMNIRLIRKDENQGCGQARQTGIDNTECEYFMFLDADDALASPFAVKVLLHNIVQFEKDIIFSNFVEQRGDLEFATFDYPNTWMHGKIFRTAFIKDRNIRFSMSRVNEDSAFYTIAIAMTSEIDYVPFLTYCWKNNKTSSTRQCDYVEKYANDFIRNGIEAINDLRRLKAADINIARTVYGWMVSVYAYYIMFCKEEKSSMYINLYINECAEFYRKTCFEKYFRMLEDDEIYRIYSLNAVLGDVIQSGYMPRETIFSFIEKLKN